MDIATWSRNQPEIGRGKPFVVLCDGKVFAGFDTMKEAQDASDMYATCNCVKPSDAQKNRKWEARHR